MPLLGPESPRARKLHLAASLIFHLQFFSIVSYKLLNVTISRLLRRDPRIVELLGDTILCGGTLHAHGGASPVADFNFYCDPFAARHVVCEPFQKSLVPLETTSQVAFGLEMLEQLPDAFTSAGKVFHRMLSHAFRAHRQLLGSEGIHLHDVVALVAVTNPELFHQETVAAVVCLSRAW